MSFIDEINSDIDWRVSELTSLKVIPLMYDLMPNHKSMLIRYAIPAIYALWEGYVKTCFELYIREINKLNIPIHDTHLNVLTHTLSSYEKLYLENARTNFTKKKEFIEYYQNKISQPLYIANKIPTKSNVDFIVINDILTRFNLDLLPKTFESKIKKLLWFRNSIAHGETSLPVEIENITEFSDLVSDLMVEILTRVDTGYNNRTFVK